jgi:cell division protein FtsB
MAYLEQRRVANEQQTEMNEAEARRAQLAAEKAKLESRSGHEAVVREHNYVKPGETGPK